MEAILIQHGCAEALKGEERMSESLSLKEKSEMIDRARSAIILCIGDKVFKRSCKRKDNNLNVAETGILVYEKVSCKLAMLEATTIHLQDDRIKNSHWAIGWFQ